MSHQNGDEHGDPQLAPEEWDLFDPEEPIIEGPPPVSVEDFLRDSLEGVDPDQEAIEIPTDVESIPAPGNRSDGNYYMDLRIEED
ncbi:hypothetical protein ONR57_16300 [Hoyosella sp. YIM 151337]|uniref:hypothetical protein n=1 Tax=Hoyosella sp. YIM 151337 TaxID=2992742 RepID=UPI0022355F06|nr:hypothetical protein [Hoyosella sp. YIM 151337]MCW4354867.1 hypothetical protein [Hoyosella sp. YIM 151337]